MEHFPMILSLWVLDLEIRWWTWGVLWGNSNQSSLWFNFLLFGGGRGLILRHWLANCLLTYCLFPDHFSCDQESMLWIKEWNLAPHSALIPESRITALYSPKFIFKVAPKQFFARQNMISDHVMFSFDMLTAIEWEVLWGQVVIW